MKSLATASESSSSSSSESSSDKTSGRDDTADRAIRAKDVLPSPLVFPFSFRLDRDWSAIGSVADEVILNHPHMYML